MSKCTQCPHDVGDTHERDCSFPDCVGGWEQAFNDLAKAHQSLTQQLEDRWIEIKSDADLPKTEGHYITKRTIHDSASITLFIDGIGFGKNNIVTLWCEIPSP